MEETLHTWFYLLPLRWKSAKFQTCSPIKVGCGFAIMISFSQETLSHILPLCQIGGRSVDHFHYSYQSL